MTAYHWQPAYPTPEHQRSAAAITAFFSVQPGVDAVLLAGSTARGKASRDSCLDITVLMPPDDFARRKQALEQDWTAFYQGEDVFHSLLQAGVFSHVDMDIIDGRFTPGYHGWTSGPDEFELEIGNALVYSAPLWLGGGYLAELKERWLPYYAEDMRRERLAMVRRFCLNNLDHIALFVERGLYFQAFKRLYDALREFLQALFIARRVYPIAYDKWMREQIEDILALPELYRQLPPLLEIHHLQSRELIDKEQDLRRLVEGFTRGE